MGDHPRAPLNDPHRSDTVCYKVNAVFSPPNVGTDMSTYRIERDRGIREYRQQLAELRQKWPLAFPVHDEDVRPLAVDAAHEIAAVMGWSYPYTLGVLSRWKMAPLYCQAVLSHDQRIALDGKWWSPRRRIWRPSTLRGAQQARPRRKQRRVRRLPRRSRSVPARRPLPRRPRRQNSCATACGRRSCAGEFERAGIATGYCDSDRGFVAAI